MTPACAGGLAAGLAVLLASWAGPAPAGPALAVLDAAGRERMTVPLAADGRWCLAWRHSVAGFEVRDCFRAEAGGLVLEASHQPDFAAGLGELPGRGAVRGDGTGGYWIEGIEARLPERGLVLRLGGPAVGHRVIANGAERALPGRQGERLVLRLAGD